MNRTKTTLALSIAAILTFAAFTQSSNATPQTKQNVTIGDLVGGTVTVTTNPHGRGPMTLSGTLIGSSPTGVMLQTSKTHTWVPIQSILSVESS